MARIILPAASAGADSLARVLVCLTPLLHLPACALCLAHVLQCDYFFFLMEGEVQLQRGGVALGTLTEGSFVVRNQTAPQSQLLLQDMHDGLSL